MPTATIAVAQNGKAFVVGWDEDVGQVLEDSFDCAGQDAAEVFDVEMSTLPGIWEIDFDIVLVGETWESVTKTEPEPVNCKFTPIRVAGYPGAAFPNLRERIRV